MLAQRDGLLGWATGRLIYHDNIAPGVIRRLLTSGPARRQAIFALAAAEVGAERHEQVMGIQPDDAAAILRAEIICDGSAKDILTELLGREPPEGLRGSLERIGLSPLREARLYGRLIEVFIDPHQHAAAEALRHAGPISSAMLRVLDIVPPQLLHPGVLRRLSSPAEALGFVAAVQFVGSVNSGANHAAILEAVARLRDEAGLDDMLVRFARRADHPLGEPLAADVEIRPLLKVADLIRTARQLRNCLSSERRILGALRGRSAYAIFQHGSQDPVVMEFTKLSNGGWFYLDCHGPRNGTVQTEIEEAAHAKCQAAGVPYMPQGRGGRGRFDRFNDAYEPCLMDLAD